MIFIEKSRIPASRYNFFPGCIVTWAWSLAKGQYMVSGLLTGAPKQRYLQNRETANTGLVSWLGRFKSRSSQFVFVHPKFIYKCTQSVSLVVHFTIIIKLMKTALVASRITYYWNYLCNVEMVTQTSFTWRSTEDRRPGESLPAFIACLRASAACLASIHF